jgi:hypothetical protein
MRKLILFSVMLFLSRAELYAQEIAIMNVDNRYLEFLENHQIAYVEPYYREPSSPEYQEVFGREYARFMEAHPYGFSYPLDLNRAVLDLDTTDIMKRNYEEFSELMAAVCFRKGSVIVGYRSLDINDEEYDKVDIFEIYHPKDRYVIVEVFVRHTETGVWEF